MELCLGMTKTEIKSKLDEIIDFSGCEKYIDTPVKRYSSGMTVRLGFAVAAHLEPEILVVDEVLAVGDAEFQKKAIGKMQDLSTGEGRTVLFVSHNMASVKNLCSRAMILDNGSLGFQGETSQAVDFYLGQNESANTNGIIDYTSDLSFELEDLKLLQISIQDLDGKIRTSYTQSQEISILIKFEALNEIRNMRFNVRIETTTGEEVFMTSSHEITKYRIKTGIHKLQVRIPAFLLNERRYVLKVNSGIPGVKYYFKPFTVTSFDIISENAGGSNYIEKWPGVVAPKLKWTHEEN